MRRYHLIHTMTMSHSRSKRIQLILQPGVGAALVARLAQQPDFDSIQRFSVEELVAHFSVTPREAGLIKAAFSSGNALEVHNTWCQENAVSVIMYGDANYPPLLAQLGTPPAVLWVKGKLPQHSVPLCALVGSRAASHYGKRVVKELVPALVSHGVATVSGGALGVDSWVHEETIKAGGITVAVMGAGLAHTYPGSNAELFTRIVQSGGALVSPFPPALAPSQGTFPARNRIIAGLAVACIVVQAAEKSGALITAAHALEENREVGAVPGPIDDPLSVGVNRLLRDGARVILNGAAAVELCGGSGLVGHVPRVVHGDLLDFLDQPRTFDEIHEALLLGLEELQGKLFELELAGKIKRNHAGMWERYG